MLKKKVISFIVVALAVAWMISFAVLASTFPMNQNSAALICGAVCCVTLWVVYKIFCDIWR